MIIRAPSSSPSPLQSDDGDRIPANLLQFSNGEQKNDQAGLAVTSQQGFVRAPEFRIGASCYRALNAPALERRTAPSPFTRPGHALVASLLGVRVNRVSLTDEQPAAWVYERGDVATLFVRCYAPSVPHVTPGSQL